MTSMTKITNEIINEVKEVKAILLRQVCNEEVLLSTEPDQIVALQKSLKLLDDSCELMSEYVKLLESQDRKLDLLLERTEKRG